MRLQRRRHLHAIKTRKLSSQKEQKAEYDAIMSKRVAEKKEKVKAVKAAHHKWERFPLGHLFLLLIDVIIRSTWVEYGIYGVSLSLSCHSRDISLHRLYLLPISPATLSQAGICCRRSNCKLVNLVSLSYHRIVSHSGLLRYGSTATLTGLLRSGLFLAASMMNGRMFCISTSIRCKKQLWNTISVVPDSPLHSTSWNLRSFRAFIQHTNIMGKMRKVVILYI